nr:hypothetical protein [Marinospirillum celere]
MKTNAKRTTVKPNFRVAPTSSNWTLAPIFLAPRYLNVRLLKTSCGIRAIKPPSKASSALEGLIKPAIRAASRLTSSWANRSLFTGGKGTAAIASVFLLVFCNFQLPTLKSHRIIETKPLGFKKNPGD